MLLKFMLLTSFVSFQSLIQVQISHYAKICCQRLERNLGKRNNRKPSLEEIDLARVRMRLIIYVHSFSSFSSLNELENVSH